MHLLKNIGFAAARTGPVIGLLACAALAVVFMGCAHPQIARPAPPLSGYHYLGEGIPFRRIAMLPLYGKGTVPRDIDELFKAELAKTSLFEIIPISRAEMETVFRNQEVSSVDTLPGDLLTQLMANHGVDAVLFTDITHYFPYLPVSIGVRSKLVDARSGQIRWAFDYLFDSGNPTVARAATSYFLTNSQLNLPVASDGGSILQSPARFARYVAWETYRSLLDKPVDAGKIGLKSFQKLPN